MDKRKLICAILGLLLVAPVLPGSVGLAGAGEGAPPAPPPAPPKPPVKKKFIDLDADAWRFKDEGRRDPFTFAKVKKVNDPTDDGGTITPRDVLGEVLDAAKRSLAQAEREFKAYRYKAAIESCDRGAQAFNRVELKASDLLALQPIREQLARLRTASGRLFRRKEAEQAFQGLNIRVSGVSAKEENSLAIVNGAVVGRGDYIRGSANSGGGAIVDEIIPERVLVRFRGFRMEIKSK